MATPSTLPNFFEKYRTASRRHHQRFCQASPHSITALFRGALFVTCATFSTSIILSIRPSHRSHTTIHFTSASCGCILCPVSCVLLCVLLCVLCVTIVSAMPSNHCTAPSLYRPIVSPAYVSAAPFQLLLSPIYCRKVIPNPAPMFHALPCASCVLCPALRLVPHDPIYNVNYLLHSAFLRRPSYYLLCRAMPLCLLCASSCILLHRATLLRYNFGLSCRKVIPNPAPMLHALPCASCVLRPALRPTMRFVPCVRINIALYLLRRAMPLASLVPPLAPCHTSPLQLWFILPHSNSKHCAPSFSPLQPRI